MNFGNFIDLLCLCLRFHDYGDVLQAELVAVSLIVALTEFLVVRSRCLEMLNHLEEGSHCSFAWTVQTLP